MTASEENLVAELESGPEVPAVNEEHGESMALSVSEELARFELVQRQAKALAASDLVPKTFQKVPNAMIALELSHRMGMSPLMVMQNLYVVYNMPAWSSKFLIACFNSCGRFTAIKYEMSGEPGKDDRGCVAFCTEKATNARVEGPKVTLGMAKSEGWTEKSGSKWKTMPELMLRYRAAAFLVRSVAPEITMGLTTREEAQDIAPQEREARVVEDPLAPGKHSL